MIAVLVYVLHILMFVIDCSCTIFWTGDQCQNPRHPECLSEQTEEEIVICFEIAESKGKKCRCNTTGCIG